MIWHIFRKDLRLTWKFALAAAVLQWISIAVILKMGFAQGGGPLVALRGLVRIVAGLAACLVIVTVVHNDAVPGAAEDWLMRPIRRRDMLLAKGLFVLLAVQLPLFVGCVGEGMAFGLGFAASFLAALWQGAMMTLGVFVPALGVAAMSASILEAALVVVASVFSAVGLSMLAAFFGWSLDNGPGAMDWLEGISMTLGMFLAAAIALGIQYRSRNVIRARFASGLVFALGAAGVLLPWQSAFAVQQRIAPAPGAGQSVNLIFDLATGPRHVTGYRSHMAHPEILLPVRAEGLSAGMGLVIDRVELHLTGADGTVRDLTPVRPLFLSNQTSQSLMSYGPSLPVPRNAPVHLTADYWLTLVKETGVYSIPGTDGDIRVPSLGRCTTALRAGGDQGMFACVKAGAPVGCYTFAPSRNPMSPQCTGYAPPFVWLPDWDEITRTQSGFSPVPGAEGVIRTYAALDHFVRHLEIPSVRLADWEAIYVEK